MSRIRSLTLLFAGIALATTPTLGCGGGGGSNGNGGGGNGGGGGGCVSFTEVHARRVNADVALRKSDCYHVDESVTVTSGAKLTIQPGTTLSFAEDTSLQIRGGATISAEGTDSKPITLTGRKESRGFWKGLRLHNTTSVTSRLEHVTVEYGGGQNGANVTFSNSVKVAVENSTFQKSGNLGLKASAGTNFTSFQGNELVDNAAAPAQVHPAAIAELDASTSFSGNGTSAVRVGGGEVAGGEVTWPALGVPYRVRDNVKISGEKTAVTIEAGATFAFAEDVGLNVTDKAAFVVQGTSDSKVVFTGTTEEKGWWGGIALDKTTRSENKFEHAVIEYGGSEKWDFPNGAHPANLQLNSPYNAKVHLSIDNTTIRNSSTVGLYAGKFVQLRSFSNNTLESNAGGSASVHPTDIAGLDPSSTFSSVVTVRGGKIQEGDVTWPAIDPAYRVADNVAIEGENTSVEIAAGATFRFTEKKGLEVRSKAAFEVAGTSDSKVTFTGTNDQKGWWGGLALYKTTRAANSISHAVLEYGGNKNWDWPNAAQDANLQLNSAYNDQIEIELSNVALNSSSTAGLYVGKSATVTACSNLTFSKNQTRIEAANSTKKASVVSKCSL